MTDIEQKLNNLLPSQPIAPIKGEVNDKKTLKKVSYSKTTPVEIPKIKKIFPDEVKTSTNGLTAADQGIPNTITDKYVKIGQTMIPGELFKPKTTKIVQPGIAAAARINRELSVPSEAKSDSTYKFEQYLSQEQKDKLKEIQDDFNNNLNRRGIPKNENVSSKMEALLQMLNNTIGAINIYEPVYIDSLLLIMFNEFTNKKNREITYRQPDAQTLDYVRSNLYVPKMQISADLNYNAAFTYCDITRVNNYYSFLIDIFHFFTVSAKHSPRNVLVASIQNLGETEEEFYKMMGFDIFKAELGSVIKKDFNIRDDDILEMFYNDIFSVTSYKEEAHQLTIKQEELKDLLNHINRQLLALNDQYSIQTIELNKLISAQQGLEARGETVKLEQVEKEVIDAKEKIGYTMAELLKLRGELAFTLTLTDRRAKEGQGIPLTEEEEKKIRDIQASGAQPPPEFMEAISRGSKSEETSSPRHPPTERPPSPPRFSPRKSPAPPPSFSLTSPPPSFSLTSPLPPVTLTPTRSQSSANLTTSPQTPAPTPSATLVQTPETPAPQSDFVTAVPADITQTQTLATQPMSARDQIMFDISKKMDSIGETIQNRTQKADFITLKTDAKALSDHEFYPFVYQELDKISRTFKTDSNMTKSALEDGKNQIRRSYRQLRAKEEGKTTTEIDSQTYDELLGKAKPQPKTVEPAVRSSASSSSVSGTGLSIAQINKFHKIIFIKKIQKINTNIFLFTF